MIVHLQNQPLPGMHPLAHPLYCLTSDDVKPSHAVQVDQMVKAGIKLIQVRSKTNFSSFHLDQLKVSISKARALGVCVIINDDYLLSEALGANGVHLGKYDSLPSETRLEPDRDIIIGRTVHSLEDAQDVKSLGFCNYVGIGPIRDSSTKPDLSPSLSVQHITDIISVLSPIPCFLIGGLTSIDFQLLDKTGAKGICVCSGISSHHDFGSYLANYSAESLKYYGQTT